MPRRHHLLFLATLGLAIGAVGQARGSDERSRLLSTPIHRGASPQAARQARANAAAAFPGIEVRFHSGTTVACSDCHIAHASQSHLFVPGVPRINEPVPYPGSPAPNLIRGDDPLDLCLTCHDGQSFAPDVLGADASGIGDRSGGRFEDPAAPNFRGHDLGRGLPAGGGFGLCIRCHFSSGEDKKVTCIDCHDPHGNGVARNLQWASDPAGTPPLGLFVNPSAVGMERYRSDNVAYGTLGTAALREVSNMCLDCHHVFTGGSYIDPESDNIHNRHPSYDSERGSPNRVSQGETKGTTVPAHWNGGTGSGFDAPRVRFVQPDAVTFTDARVVDANRNGVFCLSCHRAHGSDQAFSMVWEVQDGLRATGCDQCHLVAGE